MASIDVYLGFQWGVDKETITEDDGAIQPRLLGVSSLGPNVLRATFDINMMFLEDPGSVLKPSHWFITEQISGKPLPIFYILQISDTVVDIHTADQSGVDYDVLVVGITSAWGVLIDPAYDTATFTGSEETYPAIQSMMGFFGLDSGLQEERIDISGPYLDNQDPLPLETDVLKDKIIGFDLLDAENQTDLATVQIWLEGALAYRGDTDTFLAPYDDVGSTRTVITNGHRFTFQKTSDWDSYKLITVRVYAEDTAGPPPFVLDTTYTFRIVDYALPTIDTLYPTGIDVNEQALVSFSCKDILGSGVVQASINATMGALPALVSGIFQTGFNGPSSSITPNAFNGFDVVIDRVANHPSTQTVGVSAWCQDVKGNTGTAVWSFDVRDWEGPLVTPVAPYLGETDVDTLTNITLNIRDDTDVNLNTVIVEIDPGTGFETAFVYADGSPNWFKPGYRGPGSSVSTVIGVTTIVIDYETQFQVGTTIKVRVTAKDSYGNPARLP